jgi:5'-3' exonuclease
MFFKIFPERVIPKDITEPHEIDLWKLDNMQYKTHNESTLDLDDTDLEVIKNKYYEYYMKTSDVTEGMIKKCCENYVESIIWTLSYYNGKCPSNKWYYRYEMAPFLTDIVKYFDDININFEKDIDITIMLQQLLVMPFEHNEALPKNKILELMPDMFPIKFKIDVFRKHKFYKCTPILPPVNIDNIITIANSFSKNSSK